MEILELREEGILQKLKNRWWYDRGQCPVASETASRVPHFYCICLSSLVETANFEFQSGKEGLGFIQVAGVFYILAGGLCIAALIMAVETVLYRLITPHREPTNPLIEFDQFKRMGVISTECYSPMRCVAVPKGGPPILHHPVLDGQLSHTQLPVDAQSENSGLFSRAQFYHSSIDSGSICV